MTPEDAWRDSRAAIEIQCREARADERARICAYLRTLGPWAAAAAAAVEGDHYWRHERAELLADRRADATIRAPQTLPFAHATHDPTTSAGDPQ
jgi:hypothetical protein